MGERRRRLIKRSAYKVAHAAPCFLLKRRVTPRSSHKKGEGERLKGLTTRKARERSLLYYFRVAVSSVNVVLIENVVFKSSAPQVLS